MITEVSLAISASSSGLTMSRGRLTETPCCRSGVTIMKMISSTSITSTIGVTLISELYSLAPPISIPIAKTPYVEQPPKAVRSDSLRNTSRKLAAKLFRTLFDEIVNQLGSRVLHFNAKARDLVCKVVEQPNSGHRDEDTEGRSDKSLSDSTANRFDTGHPTTLFQRFKCADDTNDRSEQTNERSR